MFNLVLWIKLASTVGISGCLWFAVKLFRERRRFVGLVSLISNWLPDSQLIVSKPGPPHHWLYGHLPVVKKIKAQLPADAHINLLHAAIAREYGLETIYYLDLWPTYDPMVIVLDPALAAQVTQLKNLPKHPMYRLMEYTVGTQSIITTTGQQWRFWRKVFDPGFSSSHLATLTPMVVGRVKVFIEKLEEHADAGDIFELLPLTKSLTIDVIGRVTMASDFNTQKQSNEIVEAFLTMPKFIPPINLDLVRLLSPSRIWNARYYQQKLDRLIGEVVDKRFQERRDGKVSPAERSLVHLALDTYEQAQAGKEATLVANPSFRRNAIHNIRGFFFAGHATTAASLCYLYYVLNKHPQVLQKLRAEHEEYLGSSPNDAEKKLQEEPHILKRMPYTTAVIKESLRLFVGAGTIRNGVSGFNLVDPKTHIQYPTYRDGPFPILVRAFPIHRNPASFSDPDSFQPERFLGSKLGDMPKDAYRPFEKVG
jgi:cytochrome P450